MKTRTLRNVVVVSLALIISGIWWSRWANILLAQYDYINTGDCKSRLTYIWPKLQVNRELPSYDAPGGLVDRLMLLSRKSQLTESERAQMAYLSRYFLSSNCGYDVISSEKPTIADQLAICAAGERLDPDNGLYPLIEAVNRLDRSLKRTSWEPPVGKQGGLSIPDERYNGSSMPPPYAPKPLHKKVKISDDQTHRHFPNRPHPLFTITDQHEFTLAIKALARASRLPLQFHHREVMSSVINQNPILLEHYACNAMYYANHSSIGYDRRLLNLTSKLQFAGEYVSEQGDRKDAQLLMESLASLAHRYTVVSDGDRDLMRLGYALLCNYLEISATMASQLGLHNQQTKYEATLNGINQLSATLMSQAEQSSENAGNFATIWMGYIINSPRTPNGLPDVSRMVDYIFADELAMSVLLAILQLLLLVGLVRMGIWKLNLASKAELPELNMKSVYIRCLLNGLLIPMAVYTLLTQLSWMPWRSQNLSDWSFVEKGAMVALAIVIPWFMLRFQLKERCLQQSIPVPNRKFESLANWLPTLAMLPLALEIYAIYLVMNFSGKHITLSTLHISALCVSGVIWLGVSLAAFKAKLRYSAYYAAASRYLLPIYVWSIIAFSVIFMPFYLGREITLLKHDMFGIGTFRSAIFNAPYDSYTAEWYKGQLAKITCSMTDSEVASLRRPE